MSECSPNPQKIMIKQTSWDDLARSPKFWWKPSPSRGLILMQGKWSVRFASIDYIIDVVGFALSYGPCIRGLHPSYYICQINSNIPTRSKPLQYINHCPKDPLHDSTLISQTIFRLLSLISLWQMS